MQRFLAFQSFPAVLTAVLLTSCGGDSGGAPSPAPPPTTHFSVTETVGSQTLTATDPVVPSMTAASSSIQVSAAPASGFSATGSLLMPRESHTATLLPDGRVLVAGGVHWGSEIGCPPGTPCMSVLDSTELFNPAKGVFTAAEDMGAPRVFHTATLLVNGDVLIAGGDDRLATVYTTAQLFDPTTGLFTSTRGNMAAARTGHTATLLGNGKVLVAGGSSIVGTELGGSSTAELYDPATGKFTPTKGNMNAARSFHTATLLGDGTVLLVGGDSDLTAEIFTPLTGMFTPTGSLSVAPPAHSATLLQSGEVLVAGGQYGRAATATTTLYNPLTRTFTPANPMLSGREGHTATRLADGKVLVIGGVLNRLKIYSSAELYDPNRGFTLAGNMATVRFHHAATLLANGEVLVTGGDSSNLAGPSKSLASAELSDIGAHPGTVRLSPQAMSFFCHSGVGPPPGCSPPEPATLTNIGSTPVYVLGVAISPATGRLYAFSQTSHCPAVLSPGQSCTIAVGFEGSTGRDVGVGKATYTATLYVSDAASGSPQKVMLTGTATNN